MAKSNKKREPLKIDLSKIQFVRIDLIHFDLTLPKEGFDAQNIAVNYTTNIISKANVESKLLFIILNIEVTNVSKTAHYASLEIDCIFHIDNFEELVQTKEYPIIHVDGHLNGILNELSFSTARGIVFSLFRGTYLHTAILPILIPNQLTPMPYAPTKK
jgi:hypothetical protein